MLCWHKVCYYLIKHSSLVNANHLPDRDKRKRPSKTDRRTKMLSLTESAQQAVDRFITGAEEAVSGLRISVTGGGCSGLQYAMALEAEAKVDDTVVECGPIKIFVDPMSAPMLQDVTVDFLDSMEGSGFKFLNPNAKASCGCGSSFSC
jgi:iron-sulfur cluster assembly accessory protein